jgi:pilus assembly protein CpaB
MIVRVILLLLGLACGVLLAAAGFYGVFGTSAPKPQAAAAPTPIVPQAMVVVAAKTIPTGTLVSSRDLRFAAVTPAQQTGGTYVRPVAANPNDQTASDRRLFGEIAGSVSRARFDEGDPIARTEMVKPGDAGFLAAVLRPGMRAVTMSVNLVTGDAGLLFPGDHVDVLLTQTFLAHETDPGNRSVSETIANDLRVIAVDQRLQAGGAPQKDGRPAQTVTLEVSALQAEQIDVGAKMGELALAIRGVQADIRTGEDNTAVPPAAPPTVWAKDLSPAAAGVLPAASGPPGKGGAPDNTKDAAKPQLRILRADKVENVVLP